MTPYAKLLTARRLRPSTIAGRTLAEESESDRGRVIFSPALRRLQQKAQVFPLELNSAVRTRLTHSLEVAYLGRLIALKIVEALPREVLGEDFDRSVAFANFAETACLVHDIGNPPFGHFGEAAIRNWFREHGDGLVKGVLGNARARELREGVLAPVLSDFLGFDGNAQGFRILTRLQWELDEYGLNLTATQLAAFLKYTRGMHEEADEHFGRKAGYFRTEASRVESVREILGLAPRQRHPLAFVMEAADDIAYCLSDVEDGIEKASVTETEFLEYVASKIESDWAILRAGLDAATKARAIERRSKWACFTRFKTAVTRAFVDEAVKRYLLKHQEIVAGSEQLSLLKGDGVVSAQLKVIKRFAERRIYTSHAAQRPELAGIRIISGLLDAYRPLLGCSRELFAKILEGDRDCGADLERRLANFLPHRHRLVYDHATENLEDDPQSLVEEWAHRAHLIVDFVAGMTDSYALELYGVISGARI